MRLTATILVTQFTCPFLRHVQYEVKQSLPVLGTRRRFGNVLHAAIAAYERGGKSLDRAHQVLAEQGADLSREDLDEARSIISWRHERRRDGEGRAFLVEGPLHSVVDANGEAVRLDVRMDRLDIAGGAYLLAEYKAGKRVDLDLVRAQLLVLSYVVHAVLGKAPQAWEVELLRARKVVQLPAETDPQALAAFTSGLSAAAVCGEHEPMPYDPAFCRRCPARAYCPRASAKPKPLAEKGARSPVQLALF